jgi:hypothetical protein
MVNKMTVDYDTGKFTEPAGVDQANKAIERFLSDIAEAMLERAKMAYGASDVAQEGDTKQPQVKVVSILDKSASTYLQATKKSIADSKYCKGSEAGGWTVHTCS